MILRIREMFLLLFISCTLAWDIMPITIDENTLYDRKSGQYVNQVQSKEAFDYRIHGADAAEFDIETITDGSCGNGGKSCAKIWLQDGVTLDREEKAQYSIMLEALDANRKIIEASPMLVNIHDENDNLPVFTSASLTQKCKENSKNGAPCGFIQATDADAGRYGKIEYTLSNRAETWKRRDGGLETRQMGMFDIDSVTGAITMKNPQDWDAEVYEYVEITVLATDNPGATSRNPPTEGTVKIYVEDINDNDPKVVDYEKKISVGELAKPGSKLGTDKYGGQYSFKAEDRDVDRANNEVTFKINTPREHPFEIINTADNKAILQIGAGKKHKLLDFETQNEWRLEVQAENEKGDPVKHETVYVEVNILDENEPPIWDSEVQIVFQEGDMAETSPKSGQPKARDPDFGGSQKISYYVEDDPEHFFAIDKETGFIKYVNSEPLDRECDSCDWRSGTYNLTLKACDTENACSTHVYPIKIIDVNDEGPRLGVEDRYVCNVLDQNYVIIDGKRKVDVYDRDDCSVDHCGPFKMEIVGQYRGKFKLEKENDNTYSIRHTEAGNLDVGKTYEIQVTGEDNQGNVQHSLVILRVCRCDSAFESATCELALVGAGSNGVAQVMAIIAAVLIVFIVVLLLIVYRVRHRDGDGKAFNGLDDEDDERANIMVYHTEGGGEEDQTDYDHMSLIRAKDAKQNEAAGLTKPIKPSKGYPGIPPEDIGQYINAAKEHADEDPSSPPYDSLLTFDYEGGNSICADLSDLDSYSGDPDEDDNYLNNWGPKFRKLAELYAGRENEAYDPSNV